MRERVYSDPIRAEVIAANREQREVQLADEKLAELGHHKRPLLKVIREFCLRCMGDNAAEVRRCTNPACSLWPYRLGKNPFTGRKGPPGFAAPAARRQFQDGRAEISAEDGQTLATPDPRREIRSV